MYTLIQYLQAQEGLLDLSQLKEASTRGSSCHQTDGNAQFVVSLLSVYQDSVEINEIRTKMYKN